MDWEAYHRNWELGPRQYSVGDVVTRDGVDRHRILDIDYDFLTLRVECIRPSAWCKFGDVEDNLIRRYQLAESLSLGEPIRR